MAEDSRSPQAGDPQVLLRQHRANYEVVRADNVEDLNKAIQGVLRASAFVSVYYAREGVTLHLIGAHDPWTDGAPAGLPERVQVLPARKGEQHPGGTLVVRRVSPDNLLFTELSIAEMKYGTSLLDIQVPEEVTGVLRNLGCLRVALLPVLEGVAMVGMFFVGARSEYLLDATSIEPLASLADLVPAVVKKFRTAQALEERSRELESFSAFNNSLAGAADLAALSELVHQRAREAIGESAFAVTLFDAVRQSVWSPLAYEAGRSSSIDRSPIEEDLTALLVDARQPLLLNEDVETQARTMGARATTGLRAKSWLGCPLVVSGTVVGALVAQDFEREHRFAQDDVRSLNALAVQTAGAIHEMQLLEDVRRRLSQAEAVAEISREISGLLIVDDLLRKAVTMIAERFYLYHVAAYLIEGEFVVLREATGDAGAQLKANDYRLPVGSKTVVGYVTAAGEAQLVADVAREPGYVANPLLPYTRGELAVPLRAEGRVIGAINVHSDRPHFLGLEDMRQLQLLADQVAAGVTNSQAFAQAQERLSQHRLLHHVTTAAASSTTIEDALNSAVQGLQVTLGGDQISILLMDRERKMLEVRAAIGYPNQEVTSLRIPIGSGITGWVASHRQSLRVEDISKESRYIAVSERVRSELAVPLIYRNETLGVLNVESTRLRAYDENDEEMLATLGGSLAAIIAHSRLLAQFREQAERERVLYDVTNRIRRSTNIQTILSTTASEINKVIGSRRASIKIDLGADSASRPPKRD